MGADEGKAFEFIRDLVENIRGTTLAFEVEMELGVRLNGQDTTVPVSFDGNFQGGFFFAGLPTYSRGRLTIGAAPGGLSADVISVPGRAYVLDESTADWEEIPLSVDRTVFPDPRSFVFDSRQGISHLTEIEVSGEETVDGTDTVVISASSEEIEVLGAPGAFDITYWFAKDDSRMIQVELLGELNIPEDTLLAQHLDPGSVDLMLTARFFDYGKQVDVLTPELMYGMFSHGALLLEDDRVLVSGGYTGVANNNVIIPFPVTYSQIYIPDTGLWEVVGGLPLEELDQETGPMISNSAVKLPDDRVLIFGIDFESEETSSGVAYLLNDEDDTWEFFAGGGVPRFDTDMLVMLDGRVLIAGGVDLSDEGSSSSFPDVSPHIEIFDPATRSWTPAAEMLQVGVGPFNEFLLLQDGRVLAMHPDFFDEDWASAQLYDPSTDTWSFTGEMPLFEDVPTAQVLLDGSVLVTTAGVFSLEDNALSYLFDPATDTWETDERRDFLVTRPLNQPRDHHALTLLPDGRVLATGGDDFFEGEAAEAHRGTTEIFDPETGEWTKGPDLQELRSNHTATLLPDGRVLLTGGIGLVVEKDEIAPTFTTEFIEP